MSNIKSYENTAAAALDHALFEGLFHFQIIDKIETDEIETERV